VQAFALFFHRPKHLGPMFEALIS